MAASRFIRQSPEQIRAEAERQLQQKATTEQDVYGGAGCMIIIGFASLLIPYIGPVIFLCCIGVGVWNIVQSWRKPRADPQQVAGLCHNWRHMLMGNCPICQAHIIIMPDAYHPQPVRCPTCGGNLQYDGGDMVSGR